MGYLTSLQVCLERCPITFATSTQCYVSAAKYRLAAHLADGNWTLLPVYRVGGGSRLSGLMLAGATAVIMFVGPSVIGFLRELPFLSMIAQPYMHPVQLALLQPWPS